MADAITYRIGALLEAKGNLGARLNQQAKSLDSLGARLNGAASKAQAFGSAMVNSASSAAMAWGKLGATVAAASAAASVAAFTKIGFEGNVGLEKMQNTIAGTLQLFGHSAGAADRLGNNIRVAGAALMEIQNIADAAPGELQDIQTLFQNMLPGARAATGQMQRILDLTKNVALFTPTFGVDFKTAGSQFSRMMSGGAGAEMETWRTLQPLIVEAGLQMEKMAGNGKIFAKSLQGANPEKITTAFNKLQKEDRLALFEKVLSTGGDELAAMYSKSWEGATAAGKSSARKVAMGFGKPLFETTKAALVNASQKGGVFSKDRVMPMAGRAEQMGKLLAVPLQKSLALLERGIRYFQDNFNAVFNTMYHAFQVGAGLLKAAFAYGFAKMAAGAALATAGGAYKAGSAAVGGARSVFGSYNNTRKRMGDSRGADAIGMLISRVARGNPIFMAAGHGFLTMGVGLMAMLPMLLMAGAALAVFSVGFVAIAGIAAYAASKWKELSDSVVKGFQDGTVTLRPLVVAAFVLWERLKAIGEAFIGGSTGATMMQGAIGMAATVVNWLSEGVALMAQIAAGMLTIVGKLANAWDAFFGEHDVDRMRKREAELMANGFTKQQAKGQLMKEWNSGSLKGPATFGDGALDLANRLSEAAKKAGAVNLKDLNPGDIEDWTKKADQAAKDLFSGDSKSGKGPKKASVSIGNAYFNVDLRNTDPDRMMLGLMDPLAKMAKMPDASPLDMPGF